MEINNKDVRFWLLNNNLVNKGFYNGKYVIDTKTGTYGNIYNPTGDINYVKIFKPIPSGTESYGNFVGEDNIGENLYNTTGSKVSNWYRGSSAFINLMENDKQFITTRLSVDITYWKDGKMLTQGAITTYIYFYGTTIRLVVENISGRAKYTVYTPTTSYEIEDPNVLDCQLYFNKNDNKIHKRIDVFGYDQIDEVLNYTYLTLNDSQNPNITSTYDKNTKVCIDCHLSESEGSWGTGYIEYVQDIIDL